MAIIALAFAFLSTGCAHIPPGELSAITPVSRPTENPRVGNAYLFRGFIGVFSTGMNQMGDDLNSAGVRTHVFQSDQWQSVANTIAEKYHDQPNAEPIVLVGHSYGADNIVRIAQSLKDKNVKIDLLVTLDPVTPPKVSPNVRQVVNLYQSNGAWDSLPWLRGIALEAEKPGTVVLANLDIRKDRTDLLDPNLNHFNIEKNTKIHAEVIRQITKVCVTRREWAVRRAPVPELTATLIRTVPTTRPGAQAMVN